MYVASTLNTARWSNELAFLMALIIILIFYAEYKKCLTQIKKQEMLHQFLNDQ